ncbi:hypothetical protein ACWCQZ_44270 [Streptomyces sp. NPDC002285]
MTDQTEPEDTCRHVEVDGETIRVRGADDLTDEGHEALTALVRAAKAKMAAEPPPVRQQLRAHAFNAVAPALQRHDEWLRLTVRRTVADAVLTAIEGFLDIGDAEAWCKTCRRVWDGKHHRCESGAEQRLAQARDAVVLHRQGLISTLELYAAIEADGPSSAATEATEPHTGLVVQPYRNDQGQRVWVFRCWGTDTCDGWLGLGHHTQTSALLERERHVAEAHKGHEPVSAETALDRVRQLHQPTGVVAAAEAGVEPDCAVCGPNRWPCPTYNAVTDLESAAPKEPTS